MNTKSPRTLPEHVTAPLTRLGEAISNGRVTAALADSVMSAIRQLPADSVGWTERIIADLAHLDWRSSPKRASLLGLLGPNAVTFGILDRHPQLAPLFLVHRNGYVRERALETLAAPPDAPFTLAVLVARMNDWVGPVRIVARYKAERLLPRTSADVIASAAPFLLDRWRRWGRWDDESLTIIDVALQRSDVSAHLAERFLGNSPGPLGAQLRDALRGPGLDSYLYDFARDSVNPSVRLVAYCTLIASSASWPIGFRKQWIDKTYGLSRPAVVFARRQVQHPHPLPDLIRAALRDRSAAVRRAGADALIEHHALFPDIMVSVDAMASDRSPSVRDRAEFLRRRLTEGRGAP